MFNQDGPNVLLEKLHARRIASQDGRNEREHEGATREHQRALTQAKSADPQTHHCHIMAQELTFPNSKLFIWSSPGFTASTPRRLPRPGVYRPCPRGNPSRCRVCGECVRGVPVRVGGK